MAISLGSLVSLVHGALLFKSYPHGCQFCGWGGLCNTCLGWLMQEKLFIHAGIFFSLETPPFIFFPERGQSCMEKLWDLRNRPSRFDAARPSQRRPWVGYGWISSVSIG